MTRIIILLGIVCLFVFVNFLSQSFKIGYYEQTLENNRHLFSDERWAHIVKVKNDFWLFIK